MKQFNTFEERIADLRNKAQTSPNAQEALHLSNLLQEPNVLAIHRLIYIFGTPLVAAKAEEAQTLYQAAKQQGREAYKTATNTVTTNQGQPRTLGGVFFILLRQHSEQLGLNWDALALPKLPANLQNSLPKPPEPLKPIPVSKPVPPPPALKPSPNPDTKIRPPRAKIVVTGSLSDKPKLNPQGLEGVIELEFITEMNSTLPRGLPNLGTTRVVVWCTAKQYNKVKDSLKSDSRFIIEGELAAGVAKDLTPFVRVICIKLSTVELEQAQRNTSIT